MTSKYLYSLARYYRLPSILDALNGPLLPLGGRLLCASKEPVHP